MKENLKPSQIDENWRSPLLLNCLKKKLQSQSFKLKQKNCNTEVYKNVKLSDKGKYIGKYRFL